MVNLKEYFFKDLIPICIKINCPFELFWNGDPIYFWQYLQVYNENELDNTKKIDLLAWEIGEYQIEALCQYFGAGKGKQVKYPAQPHSLEKEQKTKISAEQKIVNDYLAFNCYAKEFNKARATHG